MQRRRKGCRYILGPTVGKRPTMPEGRFFIGLEGIIVGQGSWNSQTVNSNLVDERGFWRA